MKRVFFIYKLTTPSGKVYVGQTYNINKRFSSYRNLSCINQPYLYNAIKKYGWDNIVKEILFDGLVSQKDVDEKETELIRHYQSQGISLNIVDKAGSPKYRSGEEHHASKKVLKIDLKGNVLQEYVNASEAAKDIKGVQSCISKACRTDALKAYGFCWRFKDSYLKEYVLELLNKPHPNSQPIVQLSKKGVFIKEWDSQSKASKELGIKQGNIWKSISGHGITSGGFMWLTKEDYLNGCVNRKEKTTGKPIRAVDAQGRVVGEFSSIIEASIILNVNRTTIIRQLKNKVTNPKKYIYEYL